MKTSVFIATSLDGFIARENGDVDWLGDAGERDEDYGFEAFFGSVDAMLMGRNTFELARSFDPWPYGAKPVFVLTSRPLELPAEWSGQVESIAGSPAEILDALSARGFEHVYVDGGQTIRSFLGAGLIERINITRIPILIGRGIPLFGPLARDIRLGHIDTAVYPNGFIQSEYQVT